MIGRTVSHYRITEKLGEGGMGVVYKAKDTLLGRTVAVKFLTQPGSGRNFRARFLREARAASSLSHPNIATVFDYGETKDGEPFIVMELVGGETLDALLRSDSPPDLRRAVRIVEHVGRALAEAHRRGVVHRDVKPANVVVVRPGEGDGGRDTVKVLDFGLAKMLSPERPAFTPQQEAPTLIGALTAENVVIGTPLYLSPEQASGGEVDERSDLFSLGAMLYECLAGRPAFQGASVGEIFRQVQGFDPPPPSAYNPAVPAELDRITLKALAKNPDERYQRAGEMLAELRAVRATLAAGDAPQRTAHLPRAAGTSRISRAIRTLERLRRPRYYVPALAALVCAVAGSMWAMRAARVPPPHPKAVERFEEGTRALRDGTYYKASKLLSDAVQIDPRFALAHARLAEAWMELDYTSRAMSSMMTAQALAREHKGLLRKEDTSYVNAIDATIRRDFPAAIRFYQEIAARTPQEPRVHVDLGRAREKNEEIDEAIKSYERAAELDPQDAAAYLRLGILLGRKQNLPAAESNFAQAEKIYQIVDNYEGVAEVYYQRGYLYDTIGKLAEARTLFQKAYDLAGNTRNEYQQIKSLLGLSSVAAKEGKTAEAKERAAQALNLARAAGIENLTAQGLINLGTAFYLRLEYGEAESYFRQALAFAEQSSGRRSAAQARLGLARLYIQQERNTGEALALLEQALRFFRQGGYAKEVSQSLLLSGRAKLQRGDYEAATREFDEQLRLAKQVGDRAQLVSSMAFIGAALVEREMYPEALRYFTDGYELSRTSGFTLNAGYALVNKADMLWRVGRYADARAALAALPDAIATLDSNYRQLLIGRGHLAAARMALSERNLPEARKEAERALVGAPPPRTVAEAEQALCMVRPLSAPARACDEAVRLAEREGDHRLVTTAVLARAESLLDGGDLRGVLADAQNALERASRSGQQESEWRARLAAGLASLGLGERDRAREHLVQADVLFSKLRQEWREEAFSGYLTRADVQFYRRRLDEALAAVK